MNSIFMNDSIWDKFYKEVISWVDTPFWDNQKVKGVGVDCIRFIGETFKTLKTEFDYTDMILSPQWWRHTEKEIMYNNIKKVLDKNNIKYEIYDYRKDFNLFRGDFLLYAINKKQKPLNHTIIYLGNDLIIHSSALKKKVVIEKFNSYLLKKIIRIVEL